MKKFLCILIIFTLLVSLVGCSGSTRNAPSGKYIAKVSEIPLFSLEFHGKNVEFSTSSSISKGTYEMVENEIHVSYENGSSDKFIYDKENDTLDWANVLTFNKEN